MIAAPTKAGAAFGFMGMMTAEAVVEESATERLVRLKAIEADGRTRDHNRRLPPSYDPEDLVTAQPPLQPVQVSDAGKDRGTAWLLQHCNEIVLEGTRNTRYDTAAAQPHFRNPVQNPLDAYYRRSLLAPEDPKLNKAYWRTGNRLRADWRTAGYQPRLTGSLEPRVAGSRPEEPGYRLDAADRLAGALWPIPGAARVCVVAVCLAGQSLADWVKGRPWPKISGAMDILRLGLDTAMQHYRRQDAERA